MFRILRWLRDGWFIFGLALLGLFALEFAYRGQGALRRALRGAEAPAARPEHPYAREPWFAFWQSREGAVGGPDHYDPYRGWWPSEYRFRYVNVDTAGRRITVHPSPERVRSRRIFLLGGSTMWGYTARDSATIPALVAARLDAAGLGDVEVVNLGQSAFNLTQETITLLLELRRGNVPVAVAFLDGNNEVAPAFQSGRAGTVLNQPLFEQTAARLRRGFWGELLGMGRHSELVKRLRRSLDEPAVPGARVSDLDGLCREVALYYRNLTRAVEGMGEEFGFHSLFLWQPLRATTGKPLTPWEQSIRSGPRYREMQQRCTAAADSLMQDRRGRSYFPLHALFDHDTTSVFLDDYGHITEAGNAAIAERITELLVPLLAR